MRIAAQLRIALPLLMASPVGLAAPSAHAGCFQECTSAAPSRGDDLLRSRDMLRECHTLCVGREAAAAKANGLDRYADCRARPVTDDEFRTLRCENGAFAFRDNALGWQFRNTLPDKLIRRVEIGMQTMSLTETVHSIRTLIPPGGETTLVVMEFYDGYPATRFSSKLARVEACPLE